MNTLRNASFADPNRPLPPFLRTWSLQNPQVSRCGNHDHFAIIYDNQADQLDFIVPYLRLGMERGEKSVFIVDDNSPATIIAAMERHGIDVDAAQATGALALITKHDAYLKNGDFDPDWMIAFLAQAVTDAQNEGFHGVRASGEMTWALGPAGNAHGRLLEYECKLNTFFAGYDMGGICQYNRRRFLPETLMHVIHTHPKLVFRGELCENPYYIPAEILTTRGEKMEDTVERLLESVAENTRLRRRLAAESEALRRSEKLAAAGKMAATIAHEVNNPLEAVVNLWYLLSQDNLSPEGREYVGLMGRELNRVSHIAKQTLEFYHAGAKVGTVNLSHIAGEAVQAFSRNPEAQSLSIAIERRTPARIYGSAGEFRRLFENLIVNAQEAGATSLRIRIAHSRDWSNPSRRGIRILIADNGPGIPSAVGARIFEPFFSTKDQKGAGLGLWVGKGIVQKYEGSLSMRTSTRLARTGTAFSIFLPTN